MPGSKKQKTRAISGATGGPSTGAGLNYQIKYGVLRALRLFPEVLSFPLRNPFIRIEPRVIQNEEVTRWDLSFEDPWEVAEAKLSPSKEDLSEWLGRAAKLGPSTAAKFVLVFSKTATRRLVALKKLMRVALEAGNEREKFRKLVDLEAAPDCADMLAELGENPSELLQRMKLLDFPEHNLDDQILFYSTMLAGEAGGPLLRDLLFTQISQAVPDRGTLHIADLLGLASGRGIKLNAPPSVNVPGLPDEVRDTLLVLRDCPQPVPGEILAKIFGTTAEKLRHRLEDAKVASAVVVADTGWKLAPLPLPLPHATEALCATALRATLAFIDAHKYEPTASQQARNAIALARSCVVTHPEAVARMFISLDKPLKSLGDKHLVFEAAELTIASARKCATRGRQEVEGEAQALICGTSWALQRIGRLEDARIAADDSLRLGEAIGWERNTAFCEKCVGRLHRIMAEDTKYANSKSELLRESAKYLERAIVRFSQSLEFGPDHPEVGDCYSLLGRTHLVAGKSSEARKAVTKASKLMPPSGGKDYLDLRILDGELLEASDPDAAEMCYSEVVNSKGRSFDSERSEIVARAYFRRGLNRAAMRNVPGAIFDLQKAQDLWDQLGEHENAARASWKRFKLQGAIPHSALKLLTAEPVLVRVAVVKGHQNRLAAFKGRKVARRSEPGSEYWLQLIRDARARVAVESVIW